jgi:hypothetical protein
MIIILAIVVASCAFGLNQIIAITDDVKFIKSVVKDQFGSPEPQTPSSTPTASVPPPPPSTPTALPSPLSVGAGTAATEA